MSLINSSKDKEISVNFDSEIETIIKRIDSENIRINKIPKKLQTYEVCMKIVKNRGYELKHVPIEIIDEKMCLCAIKSNCSAIEYVPNKILNKRFYNKALLINPKIIENIPIKYIEEQVLKEIIKIDGCFLEFLPQNKKSKEICMLAVNSNPLAIEFFPDKMKTEELYIDLLKKDCRAYQFLPPKLKTIENTKACLNQIKKMKDDKTISFHEMIEIVKTIPKRINTSKEIINIEREIGARKIITKKYDKEKQAFIVREIILYMFDKEGNHIETYKEFYTFQDFAKELNNNLSGADLKDYDFQNVDLSKYNIDNSNISSDVLIRHGLYDDSFYMKNINMTIEEPYIKEIQKNELILQDNCSELIIYGEETLKQDTKRIYYISDLHLDYKIKKKFPNHATRNEIIAYIKELVEIMICSSNPDWKSYLLVGGDISASFEINKIFYSILAQKWKYRIIVILGNHELWSYNDGEKKCSVEEIVENYRNFFGKYENIIFLQNEIFFEKFNHYNPYNSEKIIITEQKLKTIAKQKIQELARTSKLIVLGGIGFSGLNQRFNATCGLYRNTIESLEEDIDCTNKFAEVYKRINEYIGNSKIIVFSHTPKDDWSIESYNSNWIYLNGHTHHNYRQNTELKKIFADNQIGYKNEIASLKFFETLDRYDYFTFYKDGIYELSREEYMYFYNGINVRHMNFNRTKGQIIMIKRNELYAFFYKNDNRLYLLEGGKLHNIDNQDINYYYDKIDVMNSFTKRISKNINEVLIKIAIMVKEFGGDGRIHGLIVDIDFFNHIYFNPYDGKISYYYATSIVDKVFYNDIKSLLKKHNHKLYDNYTKMLEDKTNYKDIIVLNNNKISNQIQFLSDTFMYSMSNKMLTAQYLTELHVLRMWDDEIINKCEKELELLKQIK